AKQFGDKVITYDEMKKEVDATNGILIFVTSFLGLAFLVAAGCNIAINNGKPKLKVIFNNNPLSISVCVKPMRFNILKLLSSSS
ncbi:hypothetical protein IDG70_05635, partial [Staphylococcus sp. EG-SA-26]|nr:hypothetical protein [Staphylococcus sp. EG-SA-26]